MKKQKKPIYKRVWFWVVVTVIVLGAISIPQSLKTAQEGDQAAQEASIDDWTDESSDSTTKSDASSEYTESVASESSAASSSAAEPAVPIEYTNALAKAQSYVDDMYFSQARLLDQLTSAYGEQFSQAAAEYAIAHVKADYNANALQKAKDYQNDMNMSPASIHDQLTSAYGEQFTNEQADYAIAHLND